MVNSTTTVAVEAAVWVRTGEGWRRAFGRWEATEETPAVWEVSVRETELGLHELAWLEDGKIGAVIVTAPEWRPSRRDQLEALTAQTEHDVAQARARIRAKAPAGWEPRST